MEISEFQVLTAVLMKISIFWDITPCIPLQSQPTFRRNMSLLSSGPKNKPGKEPVELSTCFLSAFLLDLFTDPEDGGDIFLRNVG
jgi:hypothetical protein